MTFAHMTCARMTFARSLLLIAFLAAPAQAADVVYPAGSRIGLVPPPGMTVSKNFSGFEDRDNRVALVIVALPAAAYPEIEKSTTADSLLKQGVTLETREDVTHPLGKAFLIVGHQQIEGQRIRKWILVVSASDLTALITAQVPEAARQAYGDEAIRTALMTASVRPNVPNEEQLSLLPFRVSELAGFKIGGVIAGRAVMLTDGTLDPPAKGIDTHILVAIAVGAPAQPGRGRDASARQGVPHPRTSADRESAIRKWILVVSAGEITALVTIRMPEAAQSAYRRRRDPRRADERVGACRPFRSKSN